ADGDGCSLAGGAGCGELQAGMSVARAIKMPTISAALFLCVRCSMICSPLFRPTTRLHVLYAEDKQMIHTLEEQVFPRKQEMKDLIMDDLVWIEREAMQHRKDGNVSEAVRLYRQLLAQQPDWENGLGFYNLASCYEVLGEISSARSAYLKALVFAPQDTAILGGYASFLLRYGSP